MYFPTALYLLPLLLPFSLAGSAALEKRLTRSKLDQFSGQRCDGNGGDSARLRISSNVNIKDKACIDIDGRTHSIYLARGTGLMYRRHMEAYQATGCPANGRIESITDRDPAGPCVPIDSIMLGVPGSDLNQGRIMSVRFTKF